MKRLLASLLLLSAIVAGCGDGEQKVTGTIVSVQGVLDAIVTFEVQADGERLFFVPEDGLDVFGDGETPLSHLYEHLQTGDPVQVTYRVEGTAKVATRIEDG